MINKLFTAFDCLRGVFYIYFLKFFFNLNIKIHGLVLFGSGVVVRVGRQAQLCFGARVRIRGNCYISASTGRIVVGDRVFFNAGCVVTAHERIVIEDGATFGPNVVIVDHDHRKSCDVSNGNSIASQFICTPVFIGRGVWVGANSVILRGSVIGEGAIIGAGSVVRGEVPAGSVYVSQSNGRLIGG